MPAIKVPQADLLSMVNREGILAAIQQGQLREVLQARDPSKAISGGLSEIISYYDRRRYVCTFHRLRDGQGNPTTHFHPKDAVIQGQKYRDP